FHTFKELDDLLKARSFKLDIDQFSVSSPGYFTWLNEKAEFGIKASHSLFDDDGKLKIITPEEWDDEWVETFDISSSSDPFDDDIPF
ncbi:MAG: hypothetical protein KDI27_14835, partial [Gammaproteobacteria bacterium]|nr:hypothetical protein [Gammaproteobacteria bacterium]